MSMLSFMGVQEPEEVRCRVYGGEDGDGDEARARFVRQLAGPGVVDCPAFDTWVAALQARGWLPASPDLEPNPDGPGKIGRWRLTLVGLDAVTGLVPEQSTRLVQRLAVLPVVEEDERAVDRLVRDRSRSSTGRSRAIE